MAIWRICFRFGGGQLCGDDGHAGIGEVLGLVVVELGSGDDLADDACLGRVVAEHGDLKLARLGSRASDALLDHEFAVEAGGEVHRGRKLFAVMHLADSDRRAEVRGLHKQGILQRGFDLLGGFLRIGAPLTAQHREIRRLRQAGGGEELLHRVLVHAGGGTEDTGADVGDVGQLKEALDRAVLAEGAVQDGEDDVDVERRRDGAAAADSSSGCSDSAGTGGTMMASPRRMTAAVGVASGSPARRGFSGAGLPVEQRVCVLRGDPAAFASDADGRDVVFAAVDGLEDGGGGEE